MVITRPGVSCQVAKLKPILLNSPKIMKGFSFQILMLIEDPSRTATEDSAPAAVKNRFWPSLMTQHPRYVREEVALK